MSSVKDFCGSAAKAASAVALTLSVVGCATAPQDPNTTVSNRPQNTGYKEYGSAACRKAQVEPMEQSAFWGARGVYRQPQYSPFIRAFRSNPAIQGQFTVQSNSGATYILASQATESHLGALAGAAVGVAAANPNARRGATGAAATILGAVVGSAIGGAVDRAANAGIREAFERCRLDVMEGAYDRPGAAVPNYAPVPGAPIPSRQRGDGSWSAPAPARGIWAPQ